MKKNILVILTIFVVILLIITALYINLISQMDEVKTAYDEDTDFFLIYEDVEFDVNDFITIMNKAIEINNSHNIELDEDNNYIEDDRYSIKIYLQLDDREELIPMEALMLSDDGGSYTVNNLFGDIYYRYDSIEYHEETNRISKIIIYGYTLTSSNELSP